MPDEDEAGVALARLEERVKGFARWVDQHIEDESKLWQQHLTEQGRLIADSAATHKATSDRLYALELWRAKLGGAAIAWSVVSGVVVALLTALILRITGS